MAGTEASPLTPEAVTEAAKEVDWWKLCWCLCVPRSKRDEILAHYLPEDLRRVVVDWWFSTDPTPSWRRLIHQLDEYGASETADKIRHNVEPVEDLTFTLSNVTTAVESVQDWSGLGANLDVPVKRRGSRKEMLQYFITAMPNASWQTLAGGLYLSEEQEALERVTKYFQQQPEASLTVANLCSVLEEVVEWDDLGDYLGVPTSILSEIQKKYSDDTQRKQAMLEEWRNHHPAPSWMLVADALYSGLIGESGKYHKLLLVVKEKYLKAAAALPEHPVSCTDTSPTTSASPRKESETVQKEPVSSTPSLTPPTSVTADLDADALPVAVVSPPSPQSPPASPVSTLGSSLNKASLADIEYSDLELKENVGSGGFGTVFKGRWISKKKTVAIKMMMVLVEREVRILSLLDHPSIIQYYGTATQNTIHYIVTEFAEKGSIYDYIHKDHKKPPLSQILLWAVQVAEGMVYLHQRDIIHRDLKSSNVLLTSTMDAKICDLGSARSLDHTTQQTTAVGTYAWMSPEMLRREEVSKSCDVYSYGVLVFEIATQQVPFPDVLPIVAAVMTMEGKRPTIPETCDPRLANLIRCCWKQDAKARPTFRENLATLKTITH